MPKQTRERQWVFANDAGGKKFISLLDICLMVHQHSTGSSDELNPGQYEHWRDILKDAVRYWSEGHFQSLQFDNAVLNLIIATLNEPEFSKLFSERNK